MSAGWTCLSRPVNGDYSNAIFLLKVQNLSPGEVHDEHQNHLNVKESPKVVQTNASPLPNYQLIFISIRDT